MALHGDDTCKMMSVFQKKAFRKFQEVKVRLHLSFFTTARVDPKFSYQTKSAQDRNRLGMFPTIPHGNESAGLAPE